MRIHLFIMESYCDMKEVQECISELITCVGGGITTGDHRSKRMVLWIE